MSEKEKILVIEDEESLRELYIELLSDAGYYVDSAEDGEIGLQKINQGGWNLILLDVILPKMDGLLVLQKSQETTPPQPNGPIVLLTALAQDNLIHKALESGAVGYLVKSDITPDQVLQEVDNYLNQTKE